MQHVERSIGGRRDDADNLKRQVAGSVVVEYDLKLQRALLLEYNPTAASARHAACEQAHVYDTVLQYMPTPANQDAVMQDMSMPGTQHLSKSSAASESPLPYVAWSRPPASTSRPLPVATCSVCRLTESVCTSQRSPLPPPQS